MDVYVVLDGSVLVGVSAKLQGAELLRVNYAQKLAAERPANLRAMGSQEFVEGAVYDRQQIVNTELQDAE